MAARRFTFSWRSHSAHAFNVLFGLPSMAIRNIAAASLSVEVTNRPQPFLKKSVVAIVRCPISAIKATHSSRQSGTGIS